MQNTGKGILVLGSPGLCSLRSGQLEHGKHCQGREVLQGPQKLSELQHMAVIRQVACMCQGAENDTDDPNSSPLPGDGQDMGPFSLKELWSPSPHIDPILLSLNFGVPSLFRYFAATDSKNYKQQLSLDLPAGSWASFTFDPATWEFIKHGNKRLSSLFKMGKGNAPTVIGMKHKFSIHCPVAHWCGWHKTFSNLFLFHVPVSNP